MRSFPGGAHYNLLLSSPYLLHQGLVGLPVDGVAAQQDHARADKRRPGSVTSSGAARTGARVVCAALGRYPDTSRPRPTRKPARAAAIFQLKKKVSVQGAFQALPGLPLIVLHRVRDHGPGAEEHRGHAQSGHHQQQDGHDRADLPDEIDRDPG